MSLPQSKFLTLFLIALFANPLFSQVQLGSGIKGVTEYEHAGCSIDLNEDGTRIVVGAPLFREVLGSRPGKVTVMDFIDGDWQEVGEDIIGMGVHHLGHAVSMSDDGSRIAVVSHLSSVINVWEEQSGMWEKVANTITSYDQSDMLNVAVLSGDGKRLAMGVPRSDTTGTDKGQVTVFVNTNNMWRQVGAQIVGEETEWSLGYDVDLTRDGHRVVIGAPGVFNDIGEKVGAIQVFDEVNGQWIQVGQTLMGREASSGLGTVVDISADGKMIVVGMCSSIVPGGEGQVKTYQEVNGEWVEFGSAPLMAAEEEREYGRTLSISDDGNRLAVGARRRVVLYENNNGEWSTVVGELSVTKSSRVVALAGRGGYLAYGDKAWDDGRGRTQIFDMDRVVGINDLSPSPQLAQLYPNPTSSTLSITGPIDANALPRLYHPNGTAIGVDLNMTRPSDQEIVLDLSDLTPGLYLLELQELVYKVIKQ